MASRGGYGEACPVAHALDLIGDRWALLVVRELRLGPKRFSDLQASLPAAGPAMLSQRLRELEQHGVLRRRTLPPPAGARIYELTEWGADLEPVFGALARWGAGSPNPREGRLSADSVMLKIRTFFRPVGDPWTATIHVLLDRDGYRIRVVDGHLTELARGDLSGPADTTLTCDRMTMHAILSGTLTPADAHSAGTLTLIGDPHPIHRLVASVSVPPQGKPSPTTSAQPAL
jgi:DNA-binding HxlR family transcriptional regulator